MTANERHYKRDGILSQKHRRWGYNVPAVDIDFLLLKYDNARAVALIEHRHNHGDLNPEHSNSRALKDLAERAGLPYFIVKYRYQTDTRDLWAPATVDTPAFFQIHPMNDKALLCDMPGGWCTEQEYSGWLHKIRGRTQ